MMQIYFHSLCSYLQMVPILLEGTVHSNYNKYICEYVNIQIYLFYYFCNTPKSCITKIQLHPQMLQTTMILTWLLIIRHQKSIILSKHFWYFTSNTLSCFQRTWGPWESMSINFVLLCIERLSIVQSFPIEVLDWHVERLFSTTSGPSLTLHLVHLKHSWEII